MYIKTALPIWILSVMLTISNAYFPQYCSECEEEIWEEVPCDEIGETTLPGSTTTPYTPYAAVTSTPEVTTLPPTPSTPAYSKSSYGKPYPTQYTNQYTPRPPIDDGTSSSISPYVTLPPIVTSSPTPPPSSSYPSYPSTPSTPESSDPYQKCYCECKLGCKEFCRKVVVNTDDKKIITQITKTLQKVPYGQIESKHLHQQQFLPTAYDNAPIYEKPYDYSSLLDLDKEPQSEYKQQRPYSVENPIDYGNGIHLPKTVYPSVPIASNYNKFANIDSSVYSIQELSNILQSDHYDKSFYPNAIGTPVSDNNYDERIYNNFEATDKVAKEAAAAAAAAAAASAAASAPALTNPTSDDSSYIDKDPYLSQYPSVHEVDLVIDRYLNEYANPDSIASSYSLPEPSLPLPYLE